jgi:glycosyltransferase involved in cell wall biosynthesis
MKGSRRVLWKRAERSLRFRAAKILRHPVRLEAARRRSAHRSCPTDGSVAILIVTWNHEEFIETVLQQVYRYLRPRERVIVIDNGSTDATRRVVRSFGRGVQLRMMHANVGHGYALDLAIHSLASRYEYFVTLDPDAFPLRADWVDQLLEPLRTDVKVSGVRVHRPYAHPCGLAMRVDRFIRCGHTFVEQLAVGTPGEDAWDTGELISLRESPNVALRDADGMLDERGIGMYWDGLLYHNAYASRHLKLESPDASIDNGVTRSASRDAWNRAKAEFLRESADFGSRSAQPGGTG